MSRYDQVGYRRAEILKAELPAYEDAIVQIRDYISKSQLTIDHFAFHLGYSGQTVDRFLQGRYHDGPGRSTRLLTKVALEFIAKNPPGAMDDPRGQIHETENVATLRQWFDYCQARGKMACIYGGPGSQKTFIAEHIIGEQRRADIVAGAPYHRAFYVYCSQDIRPAELIRKLMEAAALPVAGQMQRNLTALRFALRGRRAIFVFDEAQHLSIPCLEVIRELNDQRPHFGIMLLGSHNLRNLFAHRSAELEQWNSRISQAIELPGISNEAATRIVRDELGAISFTDNKLDRLLKSCMVLDVYSREKKHYLSARKLFNSIEVIKDRAAAQPDQQTGGIQ
jgi:DNA transposition AAA+ family ATPase